MRRPCLETIFTARPARRQVARLSLAILVLCLPAGCTRKHVQDKDLLGYVLDPGNGLSQRREVNGTEIRVALRPTDLLVAQDMKYSVGLSPDSLRKVYGDKLYFVLSLRHKGGEVENRFLHDRSLYQKAVAYTTTGMEHDISVIAGNDTIRPIGYLSPRMYGGTEGNDMLVVFERGRVLQTDDFALLLEDRMFGLGIQEFAFRRKYFAEEPRLAM